MNWINRCPRMFPSMDVPPPPPPTAPPPVLDPNAAAARRAADQRLRVSRDSLLIDPGTASAGQTGTGLRIG